MKVYYTDEDGNQRILLSVNLSWTGKSTEAKSLDVMKVLTTSLTFEFFNSDHYTEIKLYRVRLKGLTTRLTQPYYRYNNFGNLY